MNRLFSLRARRSDDTDKWLVETLWRDLVVALRGFAREPILVFGASLSLALAIGANTAVFSLIESLVLRPLPVYRPADLEQFGLVLNGIRRPVFSYPIFRELSEKNHTFTGILAFWPVPAGLTSTGVARRGIVHLVSGNYFSLLGIKPALGRLLAESDDQIPNGHPVAVVSNSYWLTALGGAPDVVGQIIRIDSRQFTIIGVAPVHFFGLEVGSVPDAWIPLMMQPSVLGEGRPFFGVMGQMWLNIFGRRAPAVSEPQAQADLDVVFNQIRQGDPNRLFGKSAQVMLTIQSGLRGVSRLRSRFGSVLYILMALVALVLLVACTNVANLLLARSAYAGDRSRFG